MRVSGRITPRDFSRVRAAGQPTIVPFASLRHLGFTTKQLSFEALRTKFPLSEQSQRSFVRSGYMRETDAPLDLGLAIHHISRDSPIVKEGAHANVPIAHKITEELRMALGVERPEGLMPNAAFQKPTLWFGVSSYQTPTHADSADNVAMLLTGRKRFWLSPPTSWRALRPSCKGEHCYANVMHPVNASTYGERVRSADGGESTVADVLQRVQATEITLRAGELLYLPAGWVSGARLVPSAGSVGLECYPQAARVTSAHHTARSSTTSPTWSRR